VSVTGRGLEWERSHSRWVWFSLPFLGYWTWAVFLYIGIRAQHQRWVFWGFAYMSPFVFILPFLPDMQKTGQLPIPILLLCAAFVISGVIHAFRVKPEYLMRLTAIEQRENREMQDQKKKPESTPKTEPHHEASAQRIVSNEAREQAAPVTGTEPTLPPPPSAIPERQEQEQAQPLVEQEPVLQERTILKIDINHDSAERMAQLPEIGLILGVKIAQVREERGGFYSFEEFAEVMELSPRFAERLRPYLVF